MRGRHGAKLTVGAMDAILGTVGGARFLRAITVTMVVVILGLQSYNLWQSRQTMWRDGRRDAENVLRTLSSAMERNLYTLDLSLTGVQDVINLPGLADLPPELRNRVMFDRAATASYLGIMLVLDSTGSTRYRADQSDPGTGNYADRDYFQAHVTKGPEPFVSAPFASRIGNLEPSIALSRRLAYPDGSFQGVVVTAVRIAYFRSLFASVSLPPGGVLLLTKTDGTLILREPSADGRGDIGASLAGTPLFEALTRSLRHEVILASPVDRGEHLYISRQVDGLPLMLSVGWSVPDLFEEWNRRAAIAVAITVAVCVMLVVTVSALSAALRRSRDMEARLESLAVTDQLTGLPNRRALDFFLDAELRRARRSRHPLSIVMVDVDHFKRINDTYGHTAGDAALRQIARQIALGMRRPFDFAGRFGGEEFLAVLPETDAKGARLIAERIRVGIERATIGLPSGESTRLTVSAGIAQMQPSDDADELVARADEALYAAKRAGRNQVTELRTEAA